jgi:hypothetical protein
MCTVLPVKRVSDSELAELRQVGTVKWEPRIWWNFTLTPNIKVFLNIIIWKYSGKIVFFFCRNEVFPCFSLRCKANARGKTRKDGTWPALFLIFVLFYVLFGLCSFVYCLCVYMCTVLLSQGGYPIAVNKYWVTQKNVDTLYSSVSLE